MFEHELGEGFVEEGLVFVVLIEDSISEFTVKVNEILERDKESVFAIV